MFTSIKDKWRGLDRAWRFAILVFLVARVALSTWAMIITTVIPLAVGNLELHGEPVVTAFDLRTSERAVFSRVLGGQELRFRAAYPSMIDAETDSIWDLSGRAVSGERSGAQLSASKYTVEDVFPYRGVESSRNVFLAPWQRFDANWYLAIAEQGYGAISGDAHFPPIYPLLVKAIGTWLMGNGLFGGILISNLALIVALAMLCKTISRRFGQEVARRTIAYLIIFPTAFFFFSAYTESLYLVAALGCLLALERGQWLWAGFAVFCAILIRLQGVALLVPFAYALWQARRRETWVAVGVGGLIALSGLGVYLLLRFASGEPTVVPTSEPNLFARLAPPWENYLYALQTLCSGKFLIADALNLLVTTLCIAALVVGWRKLPPAWNLYTLASLVVLTVRMVDTQPLNSMSRYALTLFPSFVVLGLWGRGAWAQRAVLYIAFPLQLYLSAQFFMWGWVA